MNILITGASGFIGGFLVDEVLNKGWEVFGKPVAKHIRPISAGFSLDHTASDQCLRPQRT